MLARFCSSKRAAASNLDAPSSCDAAGGGDAAGVEGVRAESDGASAVGAIPRSVLPRDAPPTGFGGGFEETRTAGGRDVTLGRSDTGRRSDAGLGSSDAGFERSEDSGLSAEAHAPSMSSVDTGALDAWPALVLGTASEEVGRHEGSRDGLLPTGSPLILQNLWFSR